MNMKRFHELKELVEKSFPLSIFENELCFVVLMKNSNEDFLEKFFKFEKDIEEFEKEVEEQIRRTTQVSQKFYSYKYSEVIYKVISLKESNLMPIFYIYNRNQRKEIYMYPNLPKVENLFTKEQSTKVGIAIPLVEVIYEAYIEKGKKIKKIEDVYGLGYKVEIEHVFWQ